MGYYIVEDLAPAAVDFESFYSKELSISIQGVDLYVRTTEIYLVAIVTDDGHRYVGHPRDFNWGSLRGRRIWSHNAAFDKWCYIVIRSIALAEGEDPEEWPDPAEMEWNCTANLSVFFRGGRSLKKASKNLLGVEISKATRDAMRGVRWADTVHMPSKTHANFREEILAYADSDVNLCLDLAVTYGPHWPERERRLSLLTIQGSHTGLPLDMDKLEAGKVLLETKIWEIEQRLPWVTGITDYNMDEVQFTMQGGATALSPKGLAECCRLYGIPHPPSTAEDDARCIQWEATYGADFPWVGDMRDRRKANILLQRINVLLTQQVGGVFRYGLKYFGAHTGRWSGGVEK